MPISIQFNSDQSLLQAVVSGSFTFEESCAAVERFLSHPSLQRPETKVLWDMSEADTVGLAPAEIRELASINDEGLLSLLSHPHAVVVRHDLHFGIAREYDAYKAPNSESIRLFRSREHALRYLGACDD